MLIFLFIAIIFLQITLLAILLLLYKDQNGSCVSANVKAECAPIDNVSAAQQFKLVKQVIYLEKFTLGFKTPYSGYLYIVARACDVCFRDDRCIKVKRQLDGLFLEKDELIFIKNPVDLKCVKFVQS